MVNPFGSRGAVPPATHSLVGCARSNGFAMCMDPGWVGVCPPQCQGRPFLPWHPLANG